MGVVHPAGPVSSDWLSVMVAMAVTIWFSLAFSRWCLVSVVDSLCPVECLLARRLRDPFHCLGLANRNREPCPETIVAAVVCATCSTAGAFPGRFTHPHSIPETSCSGPGTATSSALCALCGLRIS